MNLTDNFIFLVGNPPIGFEFLPYLFSCIFLYLVCRFIFEFFVYIFGILFQNISK